MKDGGGRVIVQKTILLLHLTDKVYPEDGETGEGWLRRREGGRIEGRGLREG